LLRQDIFALSKQLLIEPNDLQRKRKAFLLDDTFLHTMSPTIRSIIILISL
jgi:hypothetical protein